MMLLHMKQAGANGGLSNFNIPGNITLWLSAENPSHPDGKTTQRVGVGRKR
jgi:hypothetical protein